MEEKSSNSLGLPTSTWITLAIAFMGIFALKQNPFQDSRPPDHWNPVYSHAASEDQDVEARLWQDPLAAVETARSASSASDAKKPATTAPMKVATHCPDPLDATEAGKALVSNVHSARHLCDSLITANAVADRGAVAGPNAVAGAKAAPGVMVLAVMVSGAPYAADIEDRRRTRYAVLAGLYRSNYMPMNSGHIGYVHLMDFYDDPAHANDLAAFEWFTDVTDPRASRPAKVLLLWLDQDGFRTKTPLAQFSRIADGILPSGLPAVVLGPADSDGLRAMVGEFKGPDAASPAASSRDITIYSSRATAADSAIMSAKNMPVPTELAPHIHLYRTIVTDDVVAKRMLDVLIDRHVRVDEIALVIERDTLYGRAMGENFKGCTNPPRAEPDEPAPNNGEPLHPLCITYLRGLDGIGPPPPKRAGTTAAANANFAKSSGQTTHTGSTSDASTGPGQLDYLRRMGSSLTALQGGVSCDDAGEADARCHPRFIKAVGVLGTDIYDKLLIFQELRPAFPDALLFTFDLDGRLSDSANLPWTRALVVASSLNLSLRPELQGDIPAFRDSYQSATFYATQLAVHRAADNPAGSVGDPLPPLAGLQWTQTPQVFEIGRKKPLDLLLDVDRVYPCRFDSFCPSLSDTRSDRFEKAISPIAGDGAIVLGFATLWILLRLALGANAVGRPWKGTHINLSRLLVILALLIVAATRCYAVWQALLGSVTQGSKYMPAPIADGAGHWGKDLLEAALVPLIFALLVRGQRKLNENAEKMRTEFLLPEPREVLIERYAAKVRERPWQRRLGEWAYVPLGHLSNAQDRIPSLHSTSELESLIARYLYRGTWRKRWARVLAACVITGIIFKLMEWLGFSLFVGVPWLVTLSQKHGVEGVISGLCFVSVQALIFWVIDAILLTRAFMLDIARDEPAWPSAELTAAGAVLGLPADLATIWLNLRLISRRTTWVGNFIWYPSLVIAGLFAATFTMQYGQYHFDSNPITLVASIALIVTAVVLLRQSAEKWRAALLEKLKNARLSLLAAGTPTGATVAQIKLLINLVTELEEGAFAPYSQQPLVRAVLLPAITFAATAGFPFLHPG